MSSMSSVLLAALLAFTVHSKQYRPVVLWHGMGDNCCLPFSMGAVKGEIETSAKQNGGSVFVHSIMAASNVISDEVEGFFGNMNSQVDRVCKQLKNIPELNVVDPQTGKKEGVNAVGFSQGGELMRAYVQRCNDPPVRQLITLGGQHMGIAEVPGCVGTNVVLCKQAAELLGRGAYLPGVRNVSIQAQYFKDPMLKDEYLKNNIFLPDINNELRPSGRPEDAEADSALLLRQKSYKDNLSSLDLFVLIKFKYDFVVVPNDSSWFAYYPWGSLDRGKILAMNETQLYQEDWLGLRKLDEAGKIVFKLCPSMHMKFTMTYFRREVLVPYLIPSQAVALNDVAYV